MSIPTVALDEGTPAGSDKVREGDNRIIEYKTQVREIMEVDHEFPSSGQSATAGQHKQLTLQEQADLGTGAAGATILGSQTESGKGELTYTDEDDNDVAITKDGALALPSGVVLPWGGTIAGIPTGYLFCNGQAVSRTTYATLFAAIGTVHGVGDGSTTFNVPDLRDVSIMGAKQDSSSVPKTNVSGSLTVTGGAATHTLTEAELAQHNHTVAVRDSSGGSTKACPDNRSGNASTINTGNAGSGSAHNNLHPYQAMPYIIKT